MGVWGWEVGGARKVGAGGGRTMCKRWLLFVVERVRKKTLYLLFPLFDRREDEIN